MSNRLPAEISETTDHQSKLAIDERFITRIQGKEFVLYAGLLDLAHQRGLVQLDVNTIQLPDKDNDHTAICRATAVSGIGETYSDIGDANPSNVTRKIVPHILRMASTRAKARCLRDFCNIGITCLEELAEFEDTVAAESSSGRSNGHSNGKAHAPIQKPEAQNNSNNSVLISSAQQQAIHNLAERRKLSKTALKVLVQERYTCPIDSLNTQQAAELIQHLQQNS